MTIAVDFDGTIVEHRYPEIGEELPFATETLKMLIKRASFYKRLSIGAKKEELSFGLSIVITPRKMVLRITITSREN